MGKPGGTVKWARATYVPRRFPATRALLITALLFGGVHRAQSQDLNALFTTTTNFTSSKSEEVDTDLRSFGQTLDLNWNRALSPTLRYRLTLRSDDTRSENTVNGDLTKSSATQFEPIFDATLATAPFSLNGGFRARALFTDGNKQEKTLLSERRWFTRLFVNPENFPTLSFQLDQFIQSNDLKPKTINQTDTRYQFTSDYNYQDFTFSTFMSNRTHEDLVTQRTRDQQSFVGALGYARNSLWGWLDLLGGYSIDYSPSHEKFSRSGIADVERRLSRGFKAAADLTPTDSTDVPLANEPGLITGGAVIPLELNTAVGFEQLISQSVSEIRLTVLPQAPFTVPENLELFLSFRVFFTNDTALLNWTEVPGGVSLIYDALDSRVRLGFAATTARFFKIYVSRNDFGGLIRTTQLEAFNLEPVTAGSKRDQSVLVHNFNTGFAVRPITRPWSLSAISYDFSMANLTQEPDSLQNTSGTHTARLVAEPHRLLTSIFTYQNSFTNSNDPGSKDTAMDLFSLVFTSTPLPTVTSSLTLSHNDTRGDSKLETRSDAGSFNVSTRLYRNLNLDSTYSIARSEDFLIDQKTLSHGGTFNANAVLTPRLHATLGYAIRWAETEGGRILDLLAQRAGSQTADLTHTITTAYTYTYSRFVNVNARYDFLTGNDVSSFNQDYRVDWTPTAKLSAFLGLRRSQQEANGEKTSSDSVTVNGRWNVSRYLYLDGNFILFRNSDGRTVNLLSARAQIRF
jgi:hypothetical protein